MEKETRLEKFRRIAETRMNRIFTNMNLIANLSNKKHYSYSQQEIDELFNAYQNKGTEIRSLFENSSSSEIILSKEFSFSSKENKNDDDEQNNKFRRIAENRMNRVFVDMNLIANLSNKKHYSYLSQDVDELFQAYENKGIEIGAYFEPLKEKFTFSNNSTYSKT
ncbi:MULTISPECIES: hypothetical protein [Bacillaceae]|uniref:hypothetical protein n=1 Tax=Bacillaceae TaxID=186817 RepID=UPI002DBCCFEA|nr:hypothetical protein [Bacillus halotolerans]MEC1543726.1 hypothetical protein [Bacillus halotolerans]